MFNTMTLTAADKKDNKKGTSGVNSILVLMQESLEFMSKIESAKESQSNPANTEMLEKFQKYMEVMYKELSGVAAKGMEDIRATRKEVTKEPDKNPELITTIPKIGLEK